MSPGFLEHWLLPIVFAAVGVACLFVDNRSAPERLWEPGLLARLSPRITLHRHPLFRYGMAAFLFVLAAVGFVTSS